MDDIKLTREEFHHETGRVLRHNVTAPVGSAIYTLMGANTISVEIVRNGVTLTYTRGHNA